VKKILETIEPYSKLNLKLEETAVENTVVMSIPLAGNLNDKGTMFAGSIYSVLVLAGWTLSYRLVNGMNSDYDVVIKESSIKYKLPVKSGARAVAAVREPLKDVRNYKTLTISVDLYDVADNLCASFVGEYVGIRKG
jgi:thioesterase domain-containing protein